MAQKFMTYEQQLNKLRVDKGLTIPDTDFARKTLEEISYYSLIGGYKGLFLHPASKKYKYGVTFDEIVAFYHFDEQLRSIFLKYILQVERHLKSMISYHFTEKYGESQNEYLDPNTFDYTHHQKQVKRLVDSLSKTIAMPSHYRYIAHHAKKYHNVPLWVATNAMTMGQTSAFYQYMPNDIQVKVSKAYPQYTEKQLHQFITIIAKCRNVCAHGERLFDFHTTDMIPDTLLVSAKYSCGFPDPQVLPIIVVDRYLDYFTTIMEDRLWQVLAKPGFRWRNRSGLSMNAAKAA